MKLQNMRAWKLPNTDALLVFGHPALMCGFHFDLRDDSLAQPYNSVSDHGLQSPQWEQESREVHVQGCKVLGRTLAGSDCPGTLGAW